MASISSTLGLRAAASAALVDTASNRAPAYLCFHFIFAYGVLSSRTIKQWYGLDHNESPRYDLFNKLEMMRRTESASANAVENYAFFAAAIGFATFAGVERAAVNAAGLVYTLARVAYGAVYVLIDHPRWSQIRGVTWWVGSVSCFYLLWKASGKLNGR